MGNAVLENIENACFAIIGGQAYMVNAAGVKTKIVRRDIVSLLSLRKILLEMENKRDDGSFYVKLKAALEEYLQNIDDVASYTHSDGQIEQSKNYLSEEKILIVLKELNKLQNTAVESIGFYA